jgi:hypothetical protein
MKVRKAVVTAFVSVTCVMVMLIGAYEFGILLGIEETIARPALLLAWGTTIIFLIALGGACLHTWRVLSRQADQVELDERGQLPILREKIAGVLTYHNLAAFAAPSTVIRGSEQSQVTVDWAPRDFVPEGYRLVGRIPESVEVGELLGLDSLFSGNGG